MSRVSFVCITSKLVCKFHLFTRWNSAPCICCCDITEVKKNNWNLTFGSNPTHKMWKHCDLTRLNPVHETIVISCMQWCRSVVKYGGQGQSGQAIKLFQSPRNISFRLPSIMTKDFHPWWCETCRIIQQQFWMKRMWLFGGQNIFWLILHIFRGWRPPVPKMACGQTSVSKHDTYTSETWYHYCYLCYCCYHSREWCSNLMNFVRLLAWALWPRFHCVRLPMCNFSLLSLQ